jgi:glycosyltransferase involved in cell wall biosynthesis
VEGLPLLSVLLCSRNPRPHYIRRTLDALRAQTLPADQWRLIIVDNGSNSPLLGQLDVAWHPCAKIEEEPMAGLTPARVRAIRLSEGPLVVFVDDDNVLQSDYLEKAVVIGSQWPQLGTWGGSLEAEFEEPPEEWTRRYWNWLAIRRISAPLWSNVMFEAAALPYGAGMCVRRAVAEHYVKSLELNKVAGQLDRTGERLWGGGDADLSYTAIKCGYGNGVFPELKLTHLMPRERFSEQYLLKLVEDMTCSHHVLNYRWEVELPGSSRSQRLLQWYQLRFVSPRERRFVEARARGLATARSLIGRWKQDHDGNQ